MRKKKASGTKTEHRERRVDGARAGSSLVVAPRRGRALERARSRALEPHPQPVGGAPGRLTGQARGAPRASGLSGASRAAPRASARVPCLPGVVPAAPPPGVPHPRRLFQHGVRPERGPADLFRRSRQRGGRSAQGGERPRGAGDRRRPPLPAGVFPAGDRRRRKPGSPLSVQRSRPAPDHPGARPGRRMAPGVGRAAGLPDLAPRVAGAGRAGHALPARQQRPRQSAGHPRHHQRAVRRRARAAPAPGARAGDRGVAPAARPAPGAGGLPPQRRPCRLRGPGARPDLHGGQRPALRRGPRGHAGRQPVHHAHPGVGGLRSLRPGTRRNVPGPVCAGAAGHRARPSPCARTGARGRSRRALQHGVPRHPRQRRGQRRQPLARGGEPPPLPAALPPVARGRGAGRARDQWRPHALVGLGRRPTRSGPRPAAPSGGAAPWRPSSRTSARASDEALWALRVEARKALVAYVRERMASHVAAWGAAPDEAAALGACLDPDALTLGFARRFAPYKRPNLLLHDTARLLRRPLQPRAIPSSW